jgi:hypothetical protein
MTTTALINGVANVDVDRRSGRRFGIWRAAGYGLLLGAGIAVLEFLYYRPLVSTPDALGLRSLTAAFLTWCGEGAMLAMTVALFERLRAPRQLSAWQHALVIVTGALAGVVVWQSFTQFVLRERFGIPVFLDYLGQPVNWSATVLYHAWMVLLFGGLAAAAIVSRRRHVRMLSALRAAELARENSRRTLVEARLAAVRAQIDPEYLFQTLAKLELLYEANPPEAGRLLEELITHLRGRVSGDENRKEDA